MTGPELKSIRRFNEAAAVMPRKSLLALVVYEHDDGASMRPRQ